MVWVPVRGHGVDWAIVVYAAREEIRHGPGCPGRVAAFNGEDRLGHGGKVSLVGE